MSIRNRIQLLEDRTGPSGGGVVHVLHSGGYLYQGQKYNRLMDLPTAPSGCGYLITPEPLTPDQWDQAVMEGFL